MIKENKRYYGELKKTIDGLATIKISTCIDTDYLCKNIRSLF